MRAFAKMMAKGGVCTVVCRHCGQSKLCGGASHHKALIGHSALRVLLKCRGDVERGDESAEDRSLFVLLVRGAEAEFSAFSFVVAVHLACCC